MRKYYKQCGSISFGSGSSSSDCGSESSSRRDGGSSNSSNCGSSIDSNANMNKSIIKNLFIVKLFTSTIRPSFYYLVGRLNAIQIGRDKEISEENRTEFLFA